MAITEITLMLIPIMYFVILSFITGLSSDAFADSLARMDTAYAEVPTLGDWGATAFFVQNATGTTFERFYGLLDLVTVIRSVGAIVDLGAVGTINIIEHPEFLILNLVMFLMFALGFLLYFLPLIIQFLQAVAEAIPF